jgi:uncharacterized protein
MIAVPADEVGLRALVYGGAVLGGGGGGSLSGGLDSVRTALAAGGPRIVPLARVDGDASLVTLSAVGSAGETSGTPLDQRHFKRAIELFEPFVNSAIDGFIASEVGPRAVTYGLQESARTGIPVVDAPANGRAHPLYVMGSLGLHLQPRHNTVTVAVGGRPGSADYVEIAIRANVANAARIVRDRAAQGGIALAVVRNPMPARFVGNHAAVGALAYAHRVGRVLLAALPDGAAAVVQALARLMGGQLLATGLVASVTLSEQRGFTIGLITIRRTDGPALRIAIYNEFMTVLEDGRPIVAFPDLIVLFDCETGLPLASAAVLANCFVAVFTVPRGRLILGSTMRDPRLLQEAKKLTRVSLRSSRLNSP